MKMLPAECQAALLQLDTYRCGEMTTDEEATFLHHLEECAYCLCMERYERALLERLRATTEPQTCPETLRARISEQLLREARDA